MKKIVILRCLRSEENCTGAACFQAFNNRSLRVMVTKKSNWWRLWPAMDAVSLPWEIAAG